MNISPIEGAIDTAIAEAQQETAANVSEFRAAVKEQVYDNRGEPEYVFSLDARAMAAKLSGLNSKREIIVAQAQVARAAVNDEFERRRKSYEDNIKTLTDLLKAEKDRVAAKLRQLDDDTGVRLSHLDRHIRAAKAFLGE